MARAQIDITLRGGEATSYRYLAADRRGLRGQVSDQPVRRYQPGDALSGTVMVTPDGDVSCSHLYVRLQWRTEGRGDRDEGKVEEADLFQGMLRGMIPSSYDFHFQLPQAPWSYAGHYVNIVWEVMVEVDVPWSANPRYHLPLIMAPQGPHTSDEWGEQNRFDVVVTAAGARIARGVLQALQELDPQADQNTWMGLLASVPARVLQGVSQATAESARMKLEQAGATVEVRPSLPV